MNESDHSLPDGTPVPLFLLQALTLLLEIAGTEPSLKEITLLPVSGKEQFELQWENQIGLHAVRIRSTKSMFLQSLVETLVGELENNDSLQDGQLVLIGMVHPRLDKIHQWGKIRLIKRSYEPEILLGEAAAAVGAFRRDTGLPLSAPAGNRAVACLLATGLEEYCSEPRRLGREALAVLLREGILQAAAKTSLAQPGLSQEQLGVGVTHPG